MPLVAPWRRAARALSVVAALAGAALAAACGDDPLSPREIAGTYAFIGIYPMDPLADVAPRIDTLVLATDGSGVQIFRWVVFSPTSGTQAMRSVTPLSYRVKGRTIYVSYSGVSIAASHDVAGSRDVAVAAPRRTDAPGSTSTLAGPHLRGTLTSRGLLLTSAYDRRDTLYYERLPIQRSGFELQ